MRYLLAPRNLPVLSELSGARALLAFDFDGTLAPIVSRRAGARMRRRTHLLFSALCQRYPCAVISGRSREDVKARLGDAAVGWVVGNHGIETGEDSGHFRRRMRTAREELEAALSDESGIDIEDKGYSLSLHFRRSRHPRRALAILKAGLASLPVRVRVRAVPGKKVLNVVPADAPDKGDALGALRAAAGATLALYIGDDVTDEDVFGIDAADWLRGVRVGASTTSAARYYLREQPEIDRVLDLLVSLRQTLPP